MMSFKLTRQYLIACLIIVVAAWNDIINMESKRPFDLSGTVKKHFALSVALSGPNANRVCSPLSLYLILGKLALGAEKPTISELEIAIGIFNKEELKQTYKNLINDLRQLPGAVTVNIASRLFLNMNSNLHKRYCRESIEVFGSCVERVNFNNPVHAADTINQWVSEQTKTKIPKLLSPGDISSSTSVVMVNAIYFAGIWKNTFERVRTETFYTMLGERNVHMMSIKKTFNYRRSDFFNCHIVDIPYDGEAASFILVLPLLRGALPALLQQIHDNPELFRGEMLRMEMEDVSLSMPKFKIETSLDLEDDLKKLGLVTMFSAEDSGLNNILKSEKVYVTKAIQKAYIEVTETGTVAAAATAIIMEKMLIEQVDVKANHPFLFYIKSQSQQLFAGTYRYPEVACFIMATTGWNEFRSTESKRPFDLKGTLKQKFAMVISLQDPNANVVCSPLSVYLTLGKLALGATKPTITELEIALGIFNKEELKDSYRTLLSSLKQLPPTVTVNIASRLFINVSSKPKESYCEESIEVFGSCVQRTDFQSPIHSANAINKWVSDNTNSKISSILSASGITPSNSIVMANAIYFTGIWKTKFSRVDRELFHTIRGERTVHMMSVTSKFNYMKSSVLDCHIVEIPYDRDAASFILLLPVMRGALSMILEEIKIKPDVLRIEMLKMEETLIKLSMPKFNIQTPIDLKNILMKLGLQTMFNSQGSGLTHMLESEVYVSNAVQKAYIQVNEMGALASTASGSIVSALSYVKEIKANYPFLFYVKSRSHQVLVGIYTGPSI